MKDRHEIYISSLLVVPINNLIKSYIHTKYGSPYFRSLQNLVKAIKKLDDLNQPEFLINKELFDKLINEAEDKNIFLTSKIIKLRKSQKVNLASQRYTPLLLINNSKIPERLLTLLQYQFAQTTLFDVQSYLKKEIGAHYRKELEVFLLSVQEKNPTYFKLMGFRTTSIGKIALASIETSLKRLIKLHNITPDDDQ